ncbi:hypothetical protein GCM10009678_26520 [Actinomadura kijaniata]|uniref:DUF397 domain-containing protein n=1 Tax=Actinomadura namibiensis TaxID=182080 RepID=A0A7W3QPJ1_ACTNM|nr:DUF397 domain-containing protein [Actinomadura namibiensis]MBA8954641.1 hypothetical protein [Actinomadura namibiensis]
MIKWRKASRSNTQGGDCVEVCNLGDVIGVRDSKNPDGEKLLISREEARALSHHIKDIS